MIKISLLLLTMFLFIEPVKAQYSSQKDAAYLATIKAVSEFKIDDEENKKQVEQLRNDKKFNAKLQKMLDKLSNSKSKNSQNSRVYNILLNAGRQIYDELN